MPYFIDTKVSNYLGIGNNSGKKTHNRFLFCSYTWKFSRNRLYLHRHSDADFGMTAKQWREDNPDKKGDIGDYASINELICLSNMEKLNAVFINDGIPQPERLIKLNQIAIHQMQVLEDVGNRKLLK